LIWKKVLLFTYFLLLVSCETSQSLNSLRSPSSNPDEVYKDNITKEASKYEMIGPSEWITTSINDFINQTNDLDEEVPEALFREREVNIPAKRNPFRNILYKEDLVEASDRTLFMFDKLFMARLLEKYLGADFKKVHPKTDGLKEFLQKHKIINSSGRVIKTEQELRAILELEYPKGFILKPPVGMSSAGKSFYKDHHEIIELIMKQDGEIYSPDEVTKPFHWEGVRRFTSGERYIIQETLDGTSGLDGFGDYGDLNEFRVHSFYNQVVDGATETRWYTKNSEARNKQVNEFVQDILDKLPKKFTNRQAWSFDVFWLPNGEMRLIEVNTNWGEPGNWSGFFRTPKTLGAYVRHFEKNFNWKFKGFSGHLLRHNLGNLKNHINHDKYEYWEDLKNWFDEKVVSIIRKRKKELSYEYYRTRPCLGLMCFSARYLFSAQDVPRVGLEVELTGVSQEKIAQELHKVIGGKIESRDDIYKYTEPETGLEKEVKTKVWKIKKSKIGKVLIVVEDNGTGMEDLKTTTMDSNVIEIITEPIKYSEAKMFQKGLDLVVKAGAIGTNSENPISIQANIDVVDEKNPKLSSKYLLDLMRNYYSQENFSSIQNEIPLVADRDRYVGGYSSEFMKRLLDPSYNPDMRTLYDDFFYRQSAEYLNFEGAWSQDIISVKSFIEKNLPKEGFESILKVFKWNDLRISSALMDQFPDDWMTSYLISTEWVKPRGLVEFRRPNNNFNVLDIFKSTVGLVQRSRQGVFSYAEIVAKKFGINPDGIRAIQAIRNPHQEPYIVRQFIGDPKNLADQSEYQEFLSLQKYGYKRSIPVWVNMDAPVRGPYIVPGESVIFHRLPDTAISIIGKYNPALINAEISKVLDHKYVEAAFWSRFAPGIMPKTKLLQSFSSKKIKPETLAKMLKKDFPSGWIIKGVWDNATQASFLISEETDLVKEVKIYKDNQEEFIKYMQEMQSKYGSSNPDLFVRKLRERPEFMGYRINKFLKKPDLAIVQEKLSIKEEYRVEVIGGKVLGNGSTIPRYQYEYPDSDEWTKDPNIKRVETYTQKAIDQLPDELKGMTFGMDIAVMQDGSIKMIESNPQGNSGFLAYDKRSVKALDKFLMRYPALVKSGEISQGMEPEEQVNWIRKFIEEDLKMSLEKHYPHLSFIKTKAVSNKNYGRQCKALLLPILRFKP